MRPLAWRSFGTPGSAPPVPQTALRAHLGARRMVKPKDEGQRTAGAEKGGQQKKTPPSPLLAPYVGLAEPFALLNLVVSSIPSLLPASLPCRLSR